MVDIANGTILDRSLGDSVQEDQYTLPPSFLIGILDKCHSQKMPANECRSFGEAEVKKYVSEHKGEILGRLSNGVIFAIVMLVLVILVGLGIAIYCCIQNKSKKGAAAASSKDSKTTKEQSAKGKPIKSNISGGKSVKIGSKIGSKAGTGAVGSKADSKSGTNEIAQPSVKSVKIGSKIGSKAGKSVKQSVDPSNPL